MDIARCDTLCCLTHCSDWICAQTKPFWLPLLLYPHCAHPLPCSDLSTPFPCKTETQESYKVAVSTTAVILRPPQALFPFRCPLAFPHPITPLYVLILTSCTFKAPYADLRRTRRPSVNFSSLVGSHPDPLLRAATHSLLSSRKCLLLCLLLLRLVFAVAFSNQTIRHSLPMRLPLSCRSVFVPKQVLSAQSPSMSSRRAKFYSVDVKKLFLEGGRRRDGRGKYAVAVNFNEVHKYGHGQLIVLKWLHGVHMLDAHAVDAHGRTMAHLAATQGILSLLAWFSHVGLLDVRVCDSTGWNVAHYAVLKNGTTTLEWLHTRGLLAGHKKVSIIAARYDYMNVLQWLHSQELLDATETDEAGRNIAHWAALNTNLKLLKWIHDCHLLCAATRTSDGWNVAHYAARYGNLEMLQWLHAQGLLDVTQKTNKLWTVAHFASRYRSLDILQWLHSQGILNTKDRIDNGRHVVALAISPALEWLKGLSTD